VTCPSTIRVIPLAGQAGLAHGRFGPDDAYVEAVWLPVLGPASFVVWRRLAVDATSTPGFDTSLERLAAAAGLGSARGTQSGIARALRRLERFGLLRRGGDGLVVVRCRLPFASAHQLERLDPSIRAVHRAFHGRAAG
jgi:hypothetical protein